MKDNKVVDHFKEVWVFGPDHNGAFSEEISSALAMPRDSRVAVVGDGKKEVTKVELRKLRGKVNKDTRFFICAHGDISEGYHALVMGTGDDASSLKGTEGLLAMFDNFSEEPMQFYLISCFSGAANKYTSLLKPGTVLVTVSEPDDVTYGSPFCRLDIYRGQSVEELFLRHFSKSSQVITYNKATNTNDEVLHYTYRPFASRLIKEADTVQTYISWSESNFIKFLTENKICTESECKAWQPLEVVASEECETLLLNHLAYLIRLDKLHSASQDLQSCFEEMVDGANSLVDGRPLIFYTVDPRGGFRKDAFEALINCGADANPFLDDETPLFFFVILCYPKNKDAINTLVKHGADPNSSQTGRPLSILSMMVSYVWKIL